MFQKILVANRGEIARRIFKTTRKMGIRSVAVYSSADKHAPFVQEADEAYYIGEAEASKSYLNIKAIIDVALKAGVDAIHPGYGFLSENVDFARACANAGIIFIGPDIHALEIMGSKLLAKQALNQSQVPLTPGYHGQDQSEERLLKEAEQIGCPILIKAANGGGGKGMRAVFDLKEFKTALQAAKREAQAYFADDSIILEQLMLEPRHIEIQIFADNHGQLVHLFERDCSIQRRHQKIIEEAPAIGLPEHLRKALADAAINVAKHIQYKGAGTVEFLVAQDKYYFMEMNTRLQVEHPVTEMITGLDLVEWQIRIAAGQPLPLEQDKIIARGHAIECRIYAEDPQAQFIPSVGQVSFLNEPQMQDLRLDSAIVKGSEISQYYDPMIAKLIVWGENREQACYKMQQALAEYAIGGIKSNRSFLQAICQHPRFVSAKYSTAFLTNESLQYPEINLEMALLAACIVDYSKSYCRSSDGIWQGNFGWHLNNQASWKTRYQLNNECYTIEVKAYNHQSCQLTLNQKNYDLSFDYQAPKLYINDGEQIHHFLIEDHPEQLSIYTKSGPISLARFILTTKEDQNLAHSPQLLAPMHASIVSLAKGCGDTVKAGETILVLEAMKMEHSITAPFNASIKAIFYEVGAQVHEGAELALLEKAPDA